MGTLNLDLTGRDRGLGKSLDNIGKKFSNNSRLADGFARAAGDAFGSKMGKGIGEALKSGDKLSTGLRDVSGGLALVGVSAGALGTAATLMESFGGAIEIAGTARKALTVATTAGTGAQVANTAATKAGAVASKVAAAGQWLLNAALTANPIGLVIVGLVAFGAAMVLLWKKSETFRTVVTGAFKTVGTIVLTLVDLWLGAFQKLAEGLSHIPFIGDKFKGVADGIQGVRNKIKGMKDDLEELGKAPPTRIPVVIDIKTATGSKVASAIARKLDMSTRAKGGNIEAGSAYIVGEDGPELITPKRSGFVHTAKQTRRLQQHHLDFNDFAKLDTSQVVDRRTRGLSSLLNTDYGGRGTTSPRAPAGMRDYIRYSRQPSVTVNITGPVYGANAKQLADGITGHVERNMRGRVNRGHLAPGIS